MSLSRSAPDQEETVPVTLKKQKTRAAVEVEILDENEDEDKDEGKGEDEDENDDLDALPACPACGRTPQNHSAEVPLPNLPPILLCDSCKENQVVALLWEGSWRAPDYFFQTDRSDGVVVVPLEEQRSILRIAALLMVYAQRIESKGSEEEADFLLSAIEGPMALHVHRNQVTAFYTWNTLSYLQPMLSSTGEEKAYLSEAGYQELVRWEQERDQRPTFRQVYVRPQHRRSGIASKLVTDFMSRFPEGKVYIESPCDAMIGVLKKVGLCADVERTETPEEVERRLMCARALGHRLCDPSPQTFTQVVSTGRLLISRGSR